MSKIIFFLVLIIGIFLYLFKVDKVITSSLQFTTDIKQSYIQTILSIQNIVDKYFYDVNEMEKLKSENEELKQFKLDYEKAKNYLKEITQTIENLDISFNNVELVTTLSYKSLGDFKELILNKPLQENKIYGLIDGEYSAGIALKKDDENIALLNGNMKCNYAVFIGENRAPGIVHQSETAEYLTIKFIPIWVEIKEGDEVITSGMDNIFFEGLKVGKVISIKKMQDIQEATILPYANTLNKRFFYLYTN